MIDILAIILGTLGASVLLLAVYFGLVHLAEVYVRFTLRKLDQVDAFRLFQHDRRAYERARRHYENLIAKLGKGK
jgi:hypothetical protein